MMHEKLESYQMLLQIAGRVARMIANWPRGNSELADQLTRALMSSILNLAEGNAKRRTTNERLRYFEISLGSIAESGAAIDIGRAFGLIDQAAHDSLKSQLKKAYVMIKALR